MRFATQQYIIFWMDVHYFTNTRWLDRKFMFMVSKITKETDRDCVMLGMIQDRDRLAVWQQDYD